jgi:hypothetical protein
LRRFSELFDSDPLAGDHFLFQADGMQRHRESVPHAPPEDAERISQIVGATIEKLSESDKKLPQIEEGRQ